MNTLKTAFFMTALILLFIAVGGAIGGKSGMTIALMFALAMNFFAYWFSDKIVLKMYGAKPVTEADAPELYGMVRRLSQKAGMPMPKVYIIPEYQPNAFATGRNPEHAAVAVTSGIMKMLTQEELSGVIGHELGHIRNRDILIATIAATVAGAISYLAHMALWFGMARSDDDEGGNPFAAILMAILAPIAAMLIQMAISRSREFIADRAGAEIAGNPMWLASALRKIESAAHEIPMEHATPATSHMFIVTPLSGGGIASLFRTHPTTEQRIARLSEMARGR